MLEFVAAVAAAIAAVAPVVKNLGEIAKGGRHMLDFADNILRRLARKGSNGHAQVELRQALTQVAAMPQVEFDKKAEEIIDVELADKPPEYRKAVTEYVKLIPPRIRASFSRPEDPTGTTAPAEVVGDASRRHRAVSAAAPADVPGRRFAAGSGPMDPHRAPRHRRIRGSLEGPQQDDAEQLLRVQVLPRPGFAATHLRE